MLTKLLAAIEKELRANPDCPPRHIQEVARVHLEQDHSELEAFELAERYAPRLKTLLVRVRDERLAAGEDPWVEFNSSSPDYIQGPYFIEPRDPVDLQAAKRNRLRTMPLRAALESLSYGQFEFVCAAILSLLGAREVHRTTYSKDHGIDFHGQLVLGDLETSPYPYFRFADAMKLWLVGQAKHYKDGKVGAPEVRNLVGSIGLARFKEYATATDLTHDLALRSCDPVFVLFMTTGTYTRDATALAAKSGVVLKDVDDLARLLADKSVQSSDPAKEMTASELARWAKGIVTGEESKPSSTETLNAA